MNAEERAESPRYASEAKAHHIAYATRIKFSFSTMHFQQSAQREQKKLGLGEVKSVGKTGRKIESEEAQNEVTLERNQKKQSKPN